MDVKLNAAYKPLTPSQAPKLLHEDGPTPASTGDFWCGQAPLALLVGQAGGILRNLLVSFLASDLCSTQPGV